MNAHDILKKIGEKNSVYGLGARAYMNDPVLGPLFIKECFNEIQESKENMEKHFGRELVEEIKDFVSHCPNNKS